MPLIVASNRDERYDRVGEKPAIREGENYRYLAPKDPVAGGSWLGLNSQGLFVALTNGLESELDVAPSRGLLVTDTLGEAGSLDEAVDLVESIDLNRYPSFALLIAGPGGIFCLEHSRGEEPLRHREKEGSFFLSDSNGMELYTFHRWSRFPWGSYGLESRPERLRGRLQNFCRQHRGFGEHPAMCKHGEKTGTLSSNILIVDLERGRILNDFAAGAPCETTYKAVEIEPKFKKTVLENWRIA